MREIVKQNFPFERDLYGEEDLRLIDCSFSGEEDGESALKESCNVQLINCFMDLRYPLWHTKNATLDKIEMSEKCRAAIWYAENIKITDSKMLGIKAVRECKNVEIKNTEIVSPEFGWKNQGVTINDCSLSSEYLFLMTKSLKLKNVKMQGKYSFQYVEDAVIEDSEFNTKDAFWHAKNVTVKNCLIKGEYLGWYSENLTLINCKIIGTQPLCYCKNLKLIDCIMEDADLSFEYSDVCANIIGNILSVKNPKSGEIRADSITEIILTKDSKYNCECKILTK